MAAFCSNCGAQVPGAFCPNCGTAVASAPGSGMGSASTAGATYAPPPQVVTTGGLEAHIASALCYTPFVIGLVCSILFLVIAPYNKDRFVRFSAFQSLFLHLALIIFWIALSIVHLLLTAIIHMLALIFVPLYPLLSLATLILFLFMMYKAFNNQKVMLPIIGELADKQA